MAQEAKRPAHRPGADLCLAAGDRQPNYTEAGSKATLVGVSPAGGDNVRVWTWAPESIVLPIGTFSLLIFTES